MAVVTDPVIGFEDGDGFDFNQQIGSTQNGLDARRGRQRVQTLVPEQLGTDLVKLRIVALDVTQIAGGANYVSPRGAFSSQQLCNVFVRPSRLGSEVSDVDRTSLLVDAGCARYQKDRDPLDVQAQRPRER